MSITSQVVVPVLQRFKITHNGDNGNNGEDFPTWTHVRFFVSGFYIVMLKNIYNVELTKIFIINTIKFMAPRMEIICIVDNNLTKLS